MGRGVKPIEYEHYAVDLYAIGQDNVSCCAPKSFTRAEVERAVNYQEPAGTERGWRISSDKKFADGDPMPNQCEQLVYRRHWLLSC